MAATAKPPPSAGWKSRKLWMTFVAMGLVVGGFCLCGHPKDLFGEYCAAILAAAGLFKAANVVQKLKGPPSPDRPPRTR